MKTVVKNIVCAYFLMMLFILPLVANWLILKNNHRGGEAESLTPIEGSKLKYSGSTILDEITISGNAEWEAAALNDWCSGNGSWGNPYLIEDVIFTVDDGDGFPLWIESSTDYFVLKNCTFIGSGGAEAGLNLMWVNNGRILNCNCSNNPNNGINMFGCINNTLSGNLIRHNNEEGIYCDTFCMENKILNNTIENNQYFGILFSQDSQNNNISNNNINFNRDGVVFISNSDDNFLKNNTFSENNLMIEDSQNIDLYNNSFYDCGITLYDGPIAKHFFDSHSIDSFNKVNEKLLYYYVNQNNLSSANFTDPGQIILVNCNETDINNLNLSKGSVGFSCYYCWNTTITDCHISDNNDRGINLIYAYNTTLYNNTLINNKGFNLKVDMSDGSLIYGNNFTGSNNAYDGGYYNRWDNGTLGNYWSDYPSTDADDDGWGDDPYAISNFFSWSYDNFPIWWDPPKLNIIEPIPHSPYETAPPNFTVEVEEGFVDTFWYSLDGVKTTIIFANNGTINQTLWNSAHYGALPITFYANDSRGAVGAFQVSVKRNFLRIIRPLSTDFFGFKSPNFTIQFPDPDVHTLWYHLEGYSENITFTGNCSIEQDAWEEIENGTVFIEFYANDSYGNIWAANLSFFKDLFFPEIEILQPELGKEFTEFPPVFEISYNETNLESIWYTLDEGKTNVTISDLIEVVNKKLWENLPNGAVKLRFYIQDQAGNVQSAYIIVWKNTPSQSESESEEEEDEKEEGGAILEDNIKDILIISLGAMSVLLALGIFLTLKKVNSLQGEFGAIKNKIPAEGKPLKKKDLKNRKLD